MADVSISYKNAEIATMNATGVKTLLTGDCFCEDDIVVSYTKPSVTLQSKTVAPTTSQQTVSPDNGYDGLSSVTVSAISPTKAAQTYTPTTTNQTIPSGRYLTGTQTILGDANLVASNIKKDVQIFGVTGTLESGGGSVTITVSQAGASFRQLFVPSSATVEIDPDSPWVTYIRNLPANSLLAALAELEVPLSCSNGITYVLYSFGTRPSYKMYSFTIGDTDGSIAI